MPQNKEYILNNGLPIPNIAFGTGVVKCYYRNKIKYFKNQLLRILRSVKHRKMHRGLKNDYSVKKTLDAAVKYGYKMFDSGRLYGHSELYIGETAARFNRENFFLITKISEDDLHRYPDCKTVHDNLSVSLKNLQTNYVDAYLLHFPGSKMIKMYKEIEKEYLEARCKSIGVCNFDIDELKQLMAACEIKPMINQVELHPLNSKPELRSFCKENNIIVMAHTPTASSNISVISSSGIMKKLTAKYNKSVPQIIYRWHIQNGVIPIVSTVSTEHLKVDLDIFDFELSDSEMREIDNLNENKVLCRYNSKKSDDPDFVWNI